MIFKLIIAVSAVHVNVIMWRKIIWKQD
jgi:hypothetical protein